MNKVHFFQHALTSNDLLKSIIEAKQTAWPFNYESQLEWINLNLKPTDIHVLLSNAEGRVLAYMNLVDISIKLDNIFTLCYGIGNVCSTERGKNWGGKLMTAVNEYLTKHNRIGVLFCKGELVKFYTQNNWSILPSEKIVIPELFPEVKTMIYPKNTSFRILEFDGKIF